jgi:hypothetical protein
MTAADMSITGLLHAAIADGKAVVVCGRIDDAAAWRQLLITIAPERSLVIALDEAARIQMASPVAGATAQLGWQHDAVAGLDGSGWLAEQADAFDPHGDAVLLLPDPLDPHHAGSRLRLGRRPAVGRLLEDKTVVDAFWDSIGIQRAPSIVADLPIDLRALGEAVDAGNGVVCSYQPRGAGPTAGGDGIWWWRSGAAPPPGAPAGGQAGIRVRVMPLLEGLPVRLHGLVLADRVICFPPMEIVALLRPEQGTFLCAGAVPTIGSEPDLLATTDRIGTGLRTRYGYRGAFSADGILTADGFRPTDLNARLTSAMEYAHPKTRVRLHAANLLVRDGLEPDANELEAVVGQAFERRDTYSIYGAITELAEGAPRHLRWQWHGRRAAASNRAADGYLTVTPTHRGWQLTAQLAIDRLPTRGPIGPFAAEVFRIADRALGTNVGHLTSPTAGQPPETEQGSPR